MITTQENPHYKENGTLILPSSSESTRPSIPLARWCRQRKTLLICMWQKINSRKSKKGWLLYDNINIKRNMEYWKFHKINNTKTNVIINKVANKSTVTKVWLRKVATWYCTQKELDDTKEIHIPDSYIVINIIIKLLKILLGETYNPVPNVKKQLMRRWRTLDDVWEERSLKGGKLVCWHTALEGCTLKPNCNKASTNKAIYNVHKCYKTLTSNYNNIQNIILTRVEAKICSITYRISTFFPIPYR